MNAQESSTQATYHVSPSGSDSNSGTESEPFATIEKARDAVRSANHAMTGDIIVLLRGGTYRTEKPIIFEPGDSGTNGFRVIYRSCPGEEAVISGGQRVTNWQPAQDGLWQASVAVSGIRQLYVNGKRAERARIEAPVGLEPWGLHGYRTRNDEVAEWPNPEDIEFCYTNIWCHTRCNVAAIRRNRDYAEISMQQPYFVLANTREGAQIQYPSAIENSLAFLRKPGQWYFDRREQQLYYWPTSDEDLESSEILAPLVETLIELRGTLDQPVQNIDFQGLTFAHATWLRPDEVGFVDLQANFTLGPESTLFARDGARLPGCVMSLYNECTKSPANVVCHATQSVRFERCTFTKLGGAGIDLEYGARDNVIAECKFCDISGSAIQLGDIQRHDHHPDDPRQVVKDNVIRNSTIHHVAQEYKGGVGIFVGYTDGTVIANNEIRDLPYSGMSVGWGWGETDAGGGGYVHPSMFDTPTPCGNNRIERNHIHHVMLELDDGGGIYTLGNMPRTTIKGNHIHDSTGRPGGIYLDEGSGYIEVAGNVVYNVSRSMNYNNRAQNRIVTCNEHDNHFDVQPSDPAFPASVVADAGPTRAGED